MSAPGRQEGETVKLRLSSAGPPSKEAEGRQTTADKVSQRTKPPSWMTDLEKRRWLNVGYGVHISNDGSWPALPWPFRSGLKL